jgi:hypothetical protein
MLLVYHDSMLDAIVEGLNGRANASGNSMNRKSSASE